VTPTADERLARQQGIAVNNAVETRSARRIRTRLTLAGTAAVALLLGGLTWVSLTPASDENVELMSVYGMDRSVELEPVVQTAVEGDQITIDVMPVAAPVKAIEKAAEAPAPKAAPARKSVTPMFDGRALRKARTMEMVVTGYSPDERSCGASADGITASGYSVWTNGMKMVAADTRVLPMKSVISIPGYNGGKPVPVLDRGGAIKGNRLDLLFPTHEQARQWGKKKLTITVWAYAD
jgi:3D (Asp-Asp-Asp) domain-containing protein